MVVVVVVAVVAMVAATVVALVVVVAAAVVARWRLETDHTSRSSESRGGASLPRVESAQ